jgi:formate C-acetyltransferase
VAYVYEGNREIDATITLRIGVLKTMTTEVKDVKEAKGRPTLVERARALRQELVLNPPHLGTERFRFLVESYKETDGLPNILRRAKLFEKSLDEKAIYIDGNPIVGSVSERRSGVLPFPEYSCKWMLQEAKHRTALGAIDSDVLNDEEKKWRDEAVNYWLDRCQWARFKKMFRERTGMDYVPFLKSGAVGLTNLATPTGSTHLDYDKVLKEGLNGIIAEVEDRLAGLGTDLQAYQKRHFYNAVLICLRAVIRHAQRYASLAGEMARNESDLERRKELERIAESLQWVPANPARNFYEAIQSFWFIHVAEHIEEDSWAIMPGYLSQLLYPLYKEDKEEGRITEEEAIGLLSMLFVKFQELGVLNADMFFLGNEGEMAQHISIGGYTPDGEDATNELDFLLIETQKIMKCAQPSLTLMYHDKLSDEFLLKCIELIRTGIGQPQFLNADRMVVRLLARCPGLTIQEARTGINSGCVPTNPPHMVTPTAEGFINMVKMLELALNNGRDPLTGLQVGPQTGEAEAFQSYDELHEAIKKQAEYIIPITLEAEAIGQCIRAEMLPYPFASAFTYDCLERGKDTLNGGARYAAVGCLIITGVDLANSLAAIRKLVFEEEKITMKELMEALAADFEGYGEIRAMCVNAPKFGNDDRYVDEIAREWWEIVWEIHQKHGGDCLGHRTIPEAYSVSMHNLVGLSTGALPNGRKARTALTDASVSAQPGTDRNGPTALVKSAASAIDTARWGSNHFNMKFHPAALEGREGARKLLALIKTYFDLGGHHIQFNCVSNETLKDAQHHPENYRDLVLRVAGYSAFFVQLDKRVQDEIIKRTELKFD